MSVSEQQVLDALRPVREPELRRSIVELDMVRRVAVDPEKRVTVTIAAKVDDDPVGDELADLVGQAVLAIDGVDGVDVHFAPMDDDERRLLKARLREGWGEHEREIGRASCRERVLASV